jgi:hypothetical protein
LTGLWTARVIGRNVYTSHQPFAVAVRGGIAGMVPGVAESEGDHPRMGTVPKTPFGLPLRPGWDLAVFAIDGRQVFNGLVPKSGLSPVPPLPPGVYLYRLTSGNLRPVAGKIVIAR